MSKNVAVDIRHMRCITECICTLIEEPVYISRIKEKFGDARDAVHRLASHSTEGHEHRNSNHPVLRPQDIGTAPPPVSFYYCIPVLCLDAYHVLTCSTVQSPS